MISVLRSGVRKCELVFLFQNFFFLYCWLKNFYPTLFMLHSYKYRLFLSFWLLFSLCALSTSSTKISAEKNPSVFMGVIIKENDPLVPFFLRSLKNFDYEKKLLSLQVHLCNTTEKTKEIVLDWIKENEADYQGMTFIDHSPLLKDNQATCDRSRIYAEIQDGYLDTSAKMKCDYCFIFSSEVFLLPGTLKQLIEKNKPIISPLLLPFPYSNALLRNFFADTTSNGYYKDHPDYLAISYHQKIGTFAVPCISTAYLIRSIYNPQLSFCKNFAGGGNDLLFK